MRDELSKIVTHDHPIIVGTGGNTPVDLGIGIQGRSGRSVDLSTRQVRQLTNILNAALEDSDE